MNLKRNDNRNDGKRGKKWIAMFASAALVAFVGVQATFAFLATGTEPITNVFKPMAYKQGQISLSKALMHPFGAGYRVPDDIDFEFTLKFEAKATTGSAYRLATTGSAYRHSTGSAYRLATTGSHLFRTTGSAYELRSTTPNAYAGYVFDTNYGKYTADDNGVIKLTLKPGNRIDISGIEEGTKVTITETQNWDQFYVQDSAVQELTVKGDDFNTVQFINIYQVLHGAKTDYEVYIDKTLEGRAMKSGDSFKFLMEYSLNGGEWKEFASTYVADKLNADGPDGAFGTANNGLVDMKFKEPGTYAFRISEVIPDDDEKLAHVTYDTTKSIFVVTVGDDDMDGTLDVLDIKSGPDSQDTVVVDNRNKEIIVSFTNTYKKPGGGGGGGGGTVKPPVEPDHNVPDMLNGDDHFAYVFGYPDGTVQPNGNITRAEVAAIFYRLLDADVRAQYLCRTNSFNDVPADAWYITDISTLAAMGIINGYPDGGAHPNDPITRAEFTAIASRFDDLREPAANTFTDITGHWAEQSILKAAKAGWIVGYEDHTIRPDTSITRAETMAIVNRVLCRQPESIDDLNPGMIHWPDNADTSAWYYITVQEATNGHLYAWKDEVHERWTELDNEKEKQSFMLRLLHSANNEE